MNKERTQSHQKLDTYIALMSSVLSIIQCGSFIGPHLMVQPTFPHVNFFQSDFFRYFENIGIHYTHAVYMLYGM